MEFCGECSSSKETNFKFHAFVFSGVCFALVKRSKKIRENPTQVIHMSNINFHRNTRKNTSNMWTPMHWSYPRVGAALNHNVSLEIQRYIPYYWCTKFGQPVFVKQTLAMNHSLFTNWFPDMFLSMIYNKQNESRIIYREKTTSYKNGINFHPPAGDMTIWPLSTQKMTIHSNCLTCSSWSKRT